MCLNPLSSVVISLQESYWRSSQIISTTDITSAWRTWFTTSPLWSEWRPKTTNTRGFWRSCSPNPASSPTLCSAHWAHCQTRQTICANCTLLQSTRVRVPLSPCSSRAPPDTFLGTVRHGVQPSVTRRCLYPHRHSNTADICRQCRDLIIIT